MKNAGINVWLLTTVYIKQEDGTIQTEANRVRLTFMQLGDYRLDTVRLNWYPCLFNGFAEARSQESRFVEGFLFKVPLLK